MCHADDGAGATVDHHTSADHRWITRESALPSRVSEYHDRIDSSGRAFVGSYQASKSRANVEQLKVVARDPGDEDPLRLAPD